MAELFWHNPEITRAALEDVSSNGSVGSLMSGPARAFLGFNHQQQPGLVPMNRDHFGYTFFTRPLMNMREDNLAADRRMSLLASKNPTSYSRYIRAALDPNTMRDWTSCPIFDRYQAFIPILTNFITSSSGWPDAVVPTYDAPEGKYKESFSMVDGPLNLRSTYDITCTFRNILGDPITDLFYYWILYTTLVFDDTLVPYPGMWFNNEIDYQTRIYRIILDQNRQTVRRIMVADAAFPLNAPLGQQANFEQGVLFSRENDNISINFRTNGVTYNDPILVDEFNSTVVYFNAGMRKSTRTRYFRKIPVWARNRLNNFGYPRIDPITNEFEWWIDKHTFYQAFSRDEARAIDPIGEAEVDATN